MRRRIVVAAVVGVGVVALVVSSLVLYGQRTQRYSVASDSMHPTLQVGDVVAVDDDRRIRRGDLVAFELHPTEPVDVGIKRVVGLPGDRVDLQDGRLVVNGEHLREDYLSPSTVTLAVSAQTVPSGSYYLLGDNRMRSKDSRTYGPIDKSSIRGVAVKIVRPRGRARSLI